MNSLFQSYNQSLLSNFYEEGFKEKSEKWRNKFAKIIDLFDPVADHFEAGTGGYVEYQQDAIDVAIVVRGQGVIASRSSRVPDLHPHLSTLSLERFLFVLYSDCDLMVGPELFVHVLSQQRTLAHTALPNYQQLHPNLLLSLTHLLFTMIINRR